VALLVDDERSRRQLDITEGTGKIPLYIKRHRERQLVFLSIVQDIVGRVVAHCHSDEFQPRIMVFAIGINQFGHFLDTAGAACGPEIHQNNLAAQAFHGNFLTLEGSESDRRGARFLLDRIENQPTQNEHYERNKEYLQGFQSVHEIGSIMEEVGMVRYIVAFVALFVTSQPGFAFDLGNLGGSDALKSLKEAVGKSSSGESVSSSAKLNALSDGDVVKGLKEALSQGSAIAVAKLGKENGFLGNEKVKIPLPDSLKSAESVLRSLGQGERVDELVTTLNRAAEAAVPEAKTLLLDAIKKMSVQDAKNVLTGGGDAATQYFRKATGSQLHDRFLPIVDKVVGRMGVTEKYNRVAGAAGKFGLVDEKQANMQEYVTNKALDGLFLMISEEEKAIRANPVQRTGYWVKKVFGAL
jgi:hypothetical protein